jgi:hypothetical protein
LTSNGNSDLLIDVQKRYISQNKFISVESSVTDLIGNTLLNLVPNTEIYNFIVSYKGRTLATFNNYQVQCQNELYSQCSIVLNLGQVLETIPSLDNYGNVSISYNLDEASNILYLYYNSLDGQSHDINQIVKKYDNTVICNNTGTGTSGTLTCSITTVYQNTTLFSDVASDGVYIGSNTFATGTDLKDLDIYGIDIYIELLMYSTMVLLFIANPILIVIGSMLGILFAVLLIFFTGASASSIIATIIYFIIAGGIIIWQISRKI